MGPDNEIDRQAAEWAARTEGSMLSAQDEAALDAWLAADRRHLGAYTKAIAVLAAIERVRAAGIQGIVQPSLAPTRRRILWAGSLAASVAALTVVGGLSWSGLTEKTYATGLGVTQVLPLSDGSTVTLNTDSKIIVRYSEHRREIRLVRGEALFDVAKNKARPFVVTVRDMDVRAVGTSFSVRMLAQDPVEVLVREGVVEIKRPTTPVVAPVVVHANAKAIAPVDAPIMVVQEQPDAVARDLAWKAGRIAFEDTSLASAAREFMRYSQTRVVIDDPAVARRTVTGLFVSNDPVGFAKGVALSLHLKAEVGQDEVRLKQP